jgi:hypothetical protein
MKNTQKNTLSMRSKIQVRWSTAPCDNGFPDFLGQTTNWKNEKPEIVSMRKAATFNRDLDRRIGQGVYRVVSYQHNGREVGFDEISLIVESAEYKKFHHD